MKRQKDKEDLLVSRIMEDFEPADVPVGFSDRVMQRVRLAEGSVLTYQPLIGRKGWILIGVILVSIIVLASMTAGPPAPEPGWIDGLLAGRSFQFPAINIDRFLSWFQPDNPRSFWIFISISSFTALVILERFLNNLRKPSGYQS